MMNTEGERARSKEIDICEREGARLNEEHRGRGSQIEREHRDRDRER